MCWSMPGHIVCSLTPFNPSTSKPPYLQPRLVDHFKHSFCQRRSSSGMIKVIIGFSSSSSPSFLDGLSIILRIEYRILDRQHNKPVLILRITNTHFGIAYRSSGIITSLERSLVLAKLETRARRHRKGEEAKT